MKSATILSFLFLPLMVVLSVPAVAGVVSMQFNETAMGGNYAGIASYPYDLSVNGGPNQWMMCLGYIEHVSGGETWQALAAPVGSLDPGTHLLDYEAAFLFEMAVADHGTNSDVNAAAWWILEGVPTLSPGAAALVSLAQGQTYKQGEFADVMLYSAIPRTESGGLGTAQDFLGTVPEPGTLALLGSAAIGVAGLLRRKLRA